jgi:hypothetical protein
MKDSNKRARGDEVESTRMQAYTRRELKGGLRKG